MGASGGRALRFRWLAGYVWAVTDHTDLPVTPPPDVDVERPAVETGPTPFAAAEPAGSRPAPTVDDPSWPAGRGERIDGDGEGDGDGGEDSAQPVVGEPPDDAGRTGTPSASGTDSWAATPPGDDGTDGRPADRGPTTAADTVAPLAVVAAADRRPPRRDPAPPDRGGPDPA